MAFIVNDTLLLVVHFVAIVAIYEPSFLGDPTLLVKPENIMKISSLQFT